MTDLEARMVSAKTEALELQRRLDSAMNGQSNSAVSAGSFFSASPPAPAAQPKSFTSAMPASWGGSSSSSSSSSSSAPKESGKAVRTTFELTQELPFGQSLKLVGSHPALGSWKEEAGMLMTWTQGHKWQASVTLPAGAAVEFKASRRKRE